MTEKSTDYKVMVALDRKALANDIAKLAHILAQQRISVIVFASSMKEAEEKAREHLLLRPGISATYIKSLNPRRLPT